MTYSMSSLSILKPIKNSALELNLSYSPVSSYIFVLVVYKSLMQYFMCCKIKMEAEWVTLRFYLTISLL